MLNPGIDSGDIIAHGIPIIKPRDNYADVNSKAIILGSKLMVKAIEDIANGSSNFVNQWTKGKLFFDRDFNGYQARRYLKTLESGVVSDFLNEQANGDVIYPERLITYPNDQLSNQIPAEKS